MKNLKLTTLLLCLLLSFCLSACGDDATETTEAETTVAETTTEAETAIAETEELTEQDVIEKILRDRISDQYSNTVIDSITINDNAGTSEDGDYIALVNLTWNVKNSGATSKKMLQMYSDDLAATLANENDTVQEIAIFWKVPYLNDNAKCSYERKSGGFAYMDMMWGTAFE